jgi:hypothetical protein
MSFRRRLAHIARTTWRVTRAVLFVSFALIALGGLVRAGTAKGVVDDRRTELRRLQRQLDEAQDRGDELDSRLAAFRTRPEVRMQTIRRELGMLRDGERVFVFR